MATAGKTRPTRGTRIDGRISESIGKMKRPPKRFPEERDGRRMNFSIGNLQMLAIQRQEVRKVRE